MELEEIKPVLETAGFSPSQAEAYVTLVEMGSGSASEIADNSDIPSTRVYNILRDLEGEGYIELYEQDSMHARIHDPMVVQDELEDLADELVDASATIEDHWDSPDLDDYSVSIVQRFETVMDQAATEIRSADNQIQLSVTVDQFETLESQLSAAVDAGVTVQVSIHTGESDTDRSLTEALFEGAATEVRHRELPSPFVAIIDRSRVFYAPHEHSMNQYGVIVDDRTHAYVFHSYFLFALWGQWETIYSADSNELPRSYVDIHRCVHDVDALLSAGGNVYATVSGKEIETGRPIELQGEIVDTKYDQSAASQQDPFNGLMGGIFNIDLETDDGAYTIGGWGAMIEDVEATRITVTDIEYPD